MTPKEKEIIKIENKYFRELIQDVLDYGRIYHYQKKRLKKLGFKNTGIK